MFKVNSLGRIIYVAATCSLIAGCAVSTYRTSDCTTDFIGMSAPAKYNIISAETIVLNTAEENGQMSPAKLNLLNQAIKTQPGDAFNNTWTKAASELDRAGYFNVRTDDTTGFKVCSRGVNPMIFEDSAASIPIQVRGIMALGPTNISPWWMGGYLLSASMSPMRKYNYGAALVTVMDQNGKTMASKVIAVQASVWFSGLLPTALFAMEPLSASSACFTSLDEREKALQTRIMIQAVTEMLCAKTGKTAVSPAQARWDNIRDAVIESLVAGNQDAAITLLKSARSEKLGGEELNGYLLLLNL